MSTNTLHDAGRGARMSAALAAMAMLTLGAQSSGASQVFTPPTTTGRSRRYEVPADSRVRHLANKEVRDWNDEIERKKAERKAAKHMKQSRR